jgi:hypothetical protein
LGAVPAGALAADTTAPMVQVNVPVQSSHLAQHSSVASSFSCSDEGGGSGLASCTGPATVDTTTTGQHIFTVTAFDQAGNQTDHTVSYFVDPDTTAPGIAIFTPGEGNHLSQGSTVQGVFFCADEPNGSGLSGCIGPPNVDTSTLGAHTYTVFASDLAGNHSSKTVNYVVDPADTAVPTIGITVPAVGQHFAHNDAVASVFACTDGNGNSGIASCNGPTQIDTANPGDHTFTVTAVDRAGNTATKSVNYVVDPDDTTAPTATVTKPTEGTHYAQGASVASAFVCADNVNGSGLASCNAPALVDTAAPGNHTFTLTAIDHSGNAATQVVNYVVDAAPVPPDTTAPAISVAVPAAAQHLFQGSAIASKFACADNAGGSGLATCAAPATVDTTTLGAHTFTVTATDKAGNKSTAVVNYVVDKALSIAIVTPNQNTSATTKADKIVNALGSIYGSSSFTLTASGTRSVTFNAPAPGVLTIRWTVGKTVVAKGSHVFAGAGAKKLTIKLTAAGKKRLKAKKGHKLAVKSTASFAPDDGEAHSRSKNLTIKAHS